MEESVNSGRVKCRLCKSNAVDLLIDFGMQPIVHHLQDAPGNGPTRFPFQLGYCANCDFLQLLKPIAPGILYENYFTLSAWKNQPHVPRLLQLMKALAGLSENSRILEVGCNDGSFLTALSEAGIRDCHGIEPSNDAYKLAVEKGHKVTHGFLGSDSDIEFEPNNFDIVITRQVLEHIVDLHDFMRSISHVLHDDGTLIIEIPDSRFTLEYLDYALWEEHVNYFTLHTVRQLLREYDFEIFHHESTLFSGKALTIFARKATIRHKKAYCPVDGDAIQKYQESFPILKSRVQHELLKKERPIVYGCGARSSIFVNFMGLQSIECFIDDQKQKQGYFVPGAEVPIVAWTEKYENRFVLLGVNTENESNLIHKRKLKPGMFLSILPPSRYLPDFWTELL